MFEPTTINGMRLANRFVRSATWAGMAGADGECTPRLVDLMADLARGGVALIITGHAYVHANGRHQPGQLGIDRDTCIPDLSHLTQAVKAHGGNIVLQLGYGGAYLSKSRLRRLSVQDLGEIVEQFGQAATRARASGFDGVQIFAAHGFLLSQMLCPRYNDREDEFGGSLENRARFLLEALHAVRKAVGDDYPILVKINSRDFVENGLTLEESVRVGRWLENASIDAIELSGGLLNIANLLDNKIESSEDEAFFRGEAAVFKKKLGVPLILVGGVRSYGIARQLVKEGVTDYIAMCRPLICEPDLINRWKSGDLKKAACISCNNCIEQAQKGRGINCIPVVKEVVTFFPQFSELVPASPPHPSQTAYKVSIGLEEVNSRYFQAIKVQMVSNGQVIEDRSPSYPLGTDDYNQVQRSIAKLIEEHKKG